MTGVRIVNNLLKTLTECCRLAISCRYDRANLFRKMDDCLFIAAMGPPGGGRNNITSRYGRHFNQITIVDFDDASLKRIFSTLLEWGLTRVAFPDNIRVGHALSLYAWAAGRLCRIWACA